MTLLKKSAIVIVGLLVTACTMPETATRNVPLSDGSINPIEAGIERSYRLSNVVLDAPEGLTVSEANGFYPIADVVWRGDPVGNRVEQVMAMFDTAMTRADDELNGEVPVIVEITLDRFHGVTERTRFSVGGVYDINFDLTVIHAETGEVLEPTRRIMGELAAPGGAAALLDEQRGQTEKVRVTDYLSYLLKDELSGFTTL